MLPKKKRLPIASEAFWRGLSRQLPETKRGTSVSVRAGRNALGVNRYGIVISGRSVVPAVRRNRVRRVLSAAIEEMDRTLVQGFDVLVTATPERGAQEPEGEAKEETARILGGMLGAREKK